MIFALAFASAIPDSAIGAASTPAVVATSTDTSARTPLVDTKSAMTAPANPAPIDPKQRARILKDALKRFDDGEHAQAEDAVLVVWNAYPEDTHVMILLAAIRWKRNNLPGVLEIFTTYASTYPLDGMAHFYLGLSHHLLNDRTRAIEEYRTALLIDPALAPARANLRQLDGL